MKVTSVLSLLAMFALATGCKTYLATNVASSDLTNPGLKNHSSDFYIEVASCNSYEDSRQPSKSLTDVQKSVPDIFPNSKYIECFTKQTNSFAHFSIPVLVGKIKTEADIKPDDITIFSYDKNDLILGLHIPDNLKLRLAAFNKNNQLNTISPESIYIAFNVTNDSKNNISTYSPESFINGFPSSSDDISLPPGSTTEFRLSNLDAARAFLTRDQGGEGIILTAFKSSGSSK